MLFFTLNEAFSKASYPAMLRVGVVDQNHEDQRKAIAELSYADQIRYVHVKPQDTLGVSWARSLAFSLYDGESYLLQIDSHTLFEQGWDEKLITQLFALMSKSTKPILTTFPYPFSMDNGVPIYQPIDDPETVLVIRPKPNEELRKDKRLLSFRAEHLFTKEPVLGCHIAAGFFFTLGSFVDEVPYDPFIYFHGEEQCLSTRAFTHGWDIYHPVVVPLRHLYKQANGPAYIEHHWHGEVDKERAFDSQHLIARSAKRLNKLLSGSHPIGSYGLGKVRSLDDFAKVSGIDYKNLTISDPFNGELK
jgi:hypothetical protein